MSKIYAEKASKIREKVRWLKIQLFHMVVNVGKGHLSSCYSCSELICTLFYGKFLNLTKKNLHHSDRDRFIISKGHASPVLYPIFEDMGIIPPEEIAKYNRKEALLRFYADPSIPGIEAVTGSLGHGIGIGCGHSLAAKQDKRPFMTYVLLGDGECYEGSVWEAAFFASHYKLDNLICIIDRNQLCIMDETEKCLKLDPLESKWKAFGWRTLTVNGHEIEALIQVFDEVLHNRIEKPTMIIAETIKGKGISFMENQALWHNKMPNEDEKQQILKELEQ